MESKRRMGPRDSPTRILLLEGAEHVLREEGYAALTSRRIANRVGVKQQLVYYYFETMDELIVEAFRRFAKREMERIENALSSHLPLHGLWNICFNTKDARIISELAALANRSPGLKQEVIAYIEQTRRIQLATLSAATGKEKRLAAADGGGGIASLPPVAIAFMATSVALALTREADLGISTGHAEVTALVEECLAHLEPEKSAS